MSTQGVSSEDTSQSSLHKAQRGDANMGSIDLHGGVDEVKRGVDEIRRIPLRSRQDRRKRDNDSPMPRSHTSVTLVRKPDCHGSKANRCGYCLRGEQRCRSCKEGLAVCSHLLRPLHDDLPGRAGHIHHLNCLADHRRRTQLPDALCMDDQRLTAGLDRCPAALRPGGQHLWPAKLEPPVRGAVCPGQRRRWRSTQHRHDDRRPQRPGRGRRGDQHHG